MAGFSLIELLFVLGLSATLGSLAVPGILATTDDLRAASAARYLSGRLQRVRMEAVARNAATALRFSRVGAGYTFVAYADGNRNGVLSKDILAGVDAPIDSGDRLADHFPGVELGTIPELPPIEPSGTAPGTDPIRLGSGDMAVFTPGGTATAGSLYLRSHRHAQYAIRIFGETGRTRLLKFNAATRTWTALSNH